MADTKIYGICEDGLNFGEVPPKENTYSKDEVDTKMGEHTETLTSHEQTLNTHEQTLSSHTTSINSLQSNAVLSSQVRNMVYLSQSEYDALGTKNDETMYCIYG